MPEKKKRIIDPKAIETARKVSMFITVKQRDPAGATQRKTWFVFAMSATPKSMQVH